MPHCIQLQLRKSQFPSIWPFSMYNTVCAQHLDMFAGIYVLFIKVGFAGFSCISSWHQAERIPKQNSSTRTHVLRRHKAKIQCFHISDTLLSRLLNRKLHFKTQCWCEDTDPRLVSFFSPSLFPQQDPAKTASVWHSG